MTRQPFTIDRHASLADAHELMREHQIRHLPVIEDRELVGIVSIGDLHLLETLGEVDLETTDVEEAMTAHPFVVTSDAPLDEILDIMIDHKYGSVVVMGRGGVEGIFTAIDACRVLGSLLRHEDEVALGVAG